MQVKRKGFRDKNIEMPEDLGVKIGTKEESLFERSSKITKQTIKELEDSLLINKTILECFIKKVEEERLKITSNA